MDIRSQILIESCLPLMARANVKVANKCERSRNGAISYRDFRSVSTQDFKERVFDIEV